MKWWEYRLARGAGFSVWELLASAFFNKELDMKKRKAEIAEARAAHIAKLEGSGEWELAATMSKGYCEICKSPLEPNQVTWICDECERYKFE